jgi:NAD(P)H dehydrogenase (quinone)
MSEPMILVTGATGKTGATTAALLLQRGYPVRALVHRDDPRADRLRSAGADVHIGSLEDPIAVREAMRDVQRAYFCPPLEPGALRRAAILPMRRAMPGWKPLRS